MKFIITSIVLLGTLVSYAQNTWDGGANIPTVSTNGNIGIGGSSTTSRIYIANTVSNNGIYNATTGAMTGTQNGIYNNLNSTGATGVKYGIYNYLSVATASPSYGFYSSANPTGTGSSYGLYSSVSGSNTGTKYALYAFVPNTSAGTKYGVYSDARGTGAKAGYFRGDVENYGNVIVTGNNQSRYIFHPSWNSDPLNTQSLIIAPNTTSGQDDWNFSNSTAFMYDGLLQKSINSTGKAFSVKRTDLGTDVFKINGDGKVFATEINVQLTPFPDYVFKPDYKLLPLSEVRAYIQTNGHLPNVPTAETVANEGANLGEMTKTLVEKVEELTLYLLQQQEQIELQKAVLELQQAQIDALKLQLASPKQ